MTKVGFGEDGTLQRRTVRDTLERLEQGWAWVRTVRDTLERARKN